MVFIIKNRAFFGASDFFCVKILIINKIILAIAIIM